MSPRASSGAATDEPTSTPEATADTLTIGELEARTGVPAATLRAWEQRLGFPTPVRSAGGQRRYRVSDADLVRGVLAERERGLGLSAAVASVLRQDDVGAGSLFAQMRTAHPQLDLMDISAKVMLALTYAIEDECLAHASHPLLLGCFQDQESFRRSGRRWRELARLAGRAVVLSDFASTDTRTAPEQVALPADSPLLNEWSLICLDAKFSVALVAWERPRVSSGAPRRFEGFVTLEPEVVRDAALRCVVVARAHGLVDPVDLTGQLAGGTGEDWRRPMSLLRRFAVYADA